MKRICMLAIAGVVGCAGAAQRTSTDTTKPLMTDSPLYERLGGQAAVRAVVDDFVANLTADPAVKQRFAGTDIPHLKTMLAEQICQLTGGSCRYTGKTMAEAHAGLHISDAEFDAVIADLKKSLVKLSVPDREQHELLAVLGGMRSDIVNK